MLVVLPFHQGDKDQAERLAGRIALLGGCYNHELLLAPDSLVTDPDKTIAAFRQVFTKLTVFPIKNPFTTWAEAPNHCFQEIARHIENNKLAPYWLWLEPDVVPLREDWLDALEAEYQSAKKPFMGAFVSVHTPELDVEDHMSGVGIYPGEMMKHAGNALLASDLAWDVAACDQILPQMHKTNLISHAWKHPIFENWEQVEREVLVPHPEAVLYHSSKDGSLIDLLHARNNLPVPVPAKVTVARDSGESREVNQARKGTTSDASSLKASCGPESHFRGGQFITDILIKSYPKDYEWLSYCLRAIDKFVSGFRRVVIICPADKKYGATDIIWEPNEKHTPFGLKNIGQHIVSTVEAGDPYLYQQSVKASAHEFTDADYILHIDSDVILTQPITPESFFRDGKPVWYMTAYDQIDVPWREFTEKFLGEPVEYEFMRRFPQVVPRKLHLAASGFCMAHHKMRLTDYILSQQNREFSEFNALGALAYSRAKEDFHWIDTTKAELPEPFGKQFWSYGGITPEIRVELEKILEELVYDNIVTNPRNVGGSSNQRSNDTTLHSAIRLANQMVPSGTKIRQTKEGLWVLTNDTHISKWVEEKGVLQHDFQTLPVVLPEIPVGSVVVDIGANIGDSTAPFLERVGPNGLVLAFEPNMDAFECLRRNCPSAACHPFALGEKNMPFLELAPSENAGARHLRKFGFEKEQGYAVDIASLDSLNIIQCDFIKIDVEGFELHVLKGAEQTIAKFRPKMLIEINEEALRRQETTQAEVLNWLSEHGYQWWPVNQPNLEQNAPQYDILCRYIMTMGDAGGAAEIPPWRSRTETLAELSRLSLELKRFCTAPRLTKIVRDHLRQAGVISK